jgi:hypothetical protein
MSKNSVVNENVKQVSAGSDSSSIPKLTPIHHGGAHAGKTAVEKTQSLLTIVSTAIGILGAIGTGCVWLASTFYVGHLELKSEKEVPGMAVKVYTKEGHESVFHTKWIDLMPGKYHIEVIGPKGISQHEDVSVEFNKTHTLNVALPVEAKAAEEPTPKKKKRWFQFWKSDKESDVPDSPDAAEANRGFGLGDGFLEQPPEGFSQGANSVTKPAAGGSSDGNSADGNGTGSAVNSAATNGSAKESSAQ